MKKKLYISFIIIAATMASCTDWLTIKPEQSFEESEMFKTKGGFLDALTGCYMTMRGNCYNPTGYLMGGGQGRFFVEMLSDLWPDSGNSTSKDYSFFRHEYNTSEVDGYLNATFTDLYKVVAHSTLIVRATKDNGHILDRPTYDVVRGEALAMRAYIHFDLIRIWGPMPTRVDQNKKYLPYVLELDPNPYKYITYSEYMELLMADLDEAEQLLSQSDPILTKSNATLQASQDGFLKRQNRLNYYAVLGLKARVHLWLGNKTEALRYAKMVIDAKNPDDTPRFTLGTITDVPLTGSGIDRTLFMEHLFGVREDKYMNTSTGNFGSTMPAFKIAQTNTGANAGKPNLVELFDYPKYPVDDAANTEDIRTRTLMSTLTGANAGNKTCRKYDHFTSAAGNRSVPLIRLAEMYLIVMECGNETEITDAFTKFKTARRSWTQPFEGDQDRINKIMKEYCKEFIGEGQVFFQYKRLAVENMLFSLGPCAEAEYVLPLPKLEAGFE